MQQNVEKNAPYKNESQEQQHNNFKEIISYDFSAQGSEY